MKKYVSGVVLGLALSLAVAQPTYAAENVFQRFANNVSLRFERISLMLPGNKPGKTVMRQSSFAMQDLKSADSSTVITADLLKENQSMANMKLTVAGPIEMNMQDPTNVKQSLNVAGEMTMQGTSVRANADLKVTKDMLYFRINEAPVVPYVNLQSVKGKWLKTANTSKNAEGEKEELTADQQQKIKDAYMKLLQDSQYSSAKKETKNGKAVYVVEATIPNAALIDFVKAVIEVTKSATPPTATAHDQMVEAIKKLGDIKSTIWVDRSSFYVTHMDLPLSFKPERQPGAKTTTPTAANPFAGLEDVDQVNILVTVDMKDFNKAINFEEPTDAQDAQQAFQEMMGAGAGGTMTLPTTKGTSELPGLTPQQQKELEQYQKMSAEQQKMLLELDKDGQ